MYLCTAASELSNYDTCIDSGVILIGGVIQESQCLILAELEKLSSVTLEIGLWENEVIEFHKFYTPHNVKEG